MLTGQQQQDEDRTRHALPAPLLRRHPGLEGLQARPLLPHNITSTVRRGGGAIPGAAPGAADPETKKNKKEAKPPPTSPESKTRRIRQMRRSRRSPNGLPPRESKLAAEPKATPDGGDVPVWRYNHRNTEFPWRIERTAQPLDADWRGTWILEAKDMWSIDWQQGLTPEGVRPPQAHWPFAVLDRRRREGGLNGSRGGESTGSDELLDLLRRPKPTIREQTGCESHT